MKHFSVHFFHKLLLSAAIIAIIFGGVLSLTKALLPWLPKHRTLMERLISNTLHQHVTIQHMTIGWTRLQPFLQLQNVTVGDLSRQHTPLLTLPEIDLQLNLLQSLWHLQIQFTRIIFKNAHLKLYQNNHLNWYLAGSENLSDFNDPHNTSHAFIGWLLSIRHLQLEAFTLTVTPLNWPSFRLKDASIDFKNTSDNHQLFAQAVIDGPSQAPVSLAIHLHGAWQDFPRIDAAVYVSIPQLDLHPWLLNKAWHQWRWQQGSASTQLWAQWHQTAWHSVQLSLHGEALKLTESALAHPRLMHTQQLDIRATWLPSSSPTWQGQLQTGPGQVGFGTLFRSSIPFKRIQAQCNWQNQRLSLPFLTLSTPDAMVRATLNLQLPSDASPIMDLSANAQLLNLNHASLYLPAGIMAPALVQWLDTSVKGGAGGTAQMVLRGPLSHFPFADHSGLMDIHGQLHGIKLAYWPGWPSISDLDVNCQFTHQGFHIVSHHGSELGLPIDTIDAKLPHYAFPALLQINASTHGDLNQGIHFIQNSPLRLPLKALATSIASGPFALKLSLAIPLSGPGNIQWQSDITLSQAKLNWLNYPLDLSALEGFLQLTNDSVHSEQLHGELGGATIQLNVHKALGEKRLHIDGIGTLDTQTLPKAWSFHFINGITPYKVQLALADQTSTMASEFWIQSALQGLALELPSGFSKTALSEAPLHIHGLLTNDGAIQQIDGRCLLTTQTLKVHYQENPNNAAWQFNSSNLSSTLLIDHNKHLPWVLNIQHFQWQIPETAKITANPFNFDLTSIPAMNIDAQQLHVGQQFIAHVTLQLRPTTQGIAIKEVKLNTPLYQMTGSGQWTPAFSQFVGDLSTQKLTTLLTHFSLPAFIDSSDSQVHFDLQWPGAPWQVDFTHVKGHLTAIFTNGSLPDVGNSASSSFGKLLNLLSISSLPQHLSFNFSDLSAKGFSFKHIKGEFDLAEQQVNVPALTIDSALANVNAHGCLNLPEQSYQLVMEVKPHLTSTLPIIATIAGGPILGAVSLAANMLISPAVSQIASSDYLISGPWADPNQQRYDSYQAADAALHC